ncbi:class I SAM-dependent methyltransferase [Terasakiella pusilla]|uniref:class I SAM-dependent methyltransferase n=1 Tax=Terasakiella pusilla TaxID=64973 RepID=UPI003AA941C3
MKSLLNNPVLYRLFALVTGNMKARKFFAEHIIKAPPGARVLDIGCGTGEMFEYLKNTSYSGFDMNKAYIDHAVKKYGEKASFTHGRVGSSNIEQYRDSFDIVIASGLLHHLDDQEGQQLTELAYTALKDGGTFYTLDGCYTENQSLAQRVLLNNDRGEFVRTQEKYLNIIGKVFSDYKSDTYQNLMYIPYTLAIIEAQKPKPPFSTL